MENMDKVMEMMISIIKSKTKIPEADIKDILSRDRNWNITECIEKGLVDESL
jgi:ATP-dependent protease ClpP protease subunit